MRLRFVPGAALLGLAVVAISAPAADRPAKAAKDAKPTLVVHLRSLDDLLEDARYLAKAAGKEEEARQAEKMLKRQTGGKDLEGIDVKKPIGLYGYLESDLPDSRVVLLVPVADEKAFLGMLGRFDLKAEEQKGGAGLYRIDLPRVPLPAFLRFANGYAYGTVGNPRNLDKARLPDPAAILPADSRDTASVTLNVDQIPEDLRRIALAQADLRIADQKEKDLPNETAAQKAFRLAVLDNLTNRFKNLLDEGGEVALRLNLDRTAGDLNLALSLTGKPASTMARNIAALGKVQSLGAGLLGADSALNVLVHLALPENLRKALDPVIEEGIRNGLEKEKDQAKRKVAEPIFRALGPALKMGELDAGFDFRGPNASGLYTLVMGLKVKDGKEVEKAVKEALSRAPEEGRGKVKINFAKAGEVNVHRIDPDRVDEQTRVLLGDNPIFVAVRDDAVILTGGAEGLEAIKAAAAAEPKPGRLFQLEMAMGRMAKVIGREQKSAPDIAAKVFAGPDKEADKVRFVLEGGKSLRLSVSLKAKLLAFFAQLDEAKRRGD